MGFFKKIVDWFYEDVEEVIVIQEDGSPVQQQTPSKNIKKTKKNDNHVEVEAKIQYRYPKNNFKFPLISDEEIKILNERKKMKHPNKKIETVDWEKSIDQHQDERQDVKKQKQAIHRTTKIEPKKNKRPFKRTEIPSPIYGFQRPTDRLNLRDSTDQDIHKSEPSLDDVLALLHGNKKTDNAPKADEQSVEEKSTSLHMDDKTDFTNSLIDQQTTSEKEAAPAIEYGTPEVSPNEKSPIEMLTSDEDVHASAEEDEQMIVEEKQAISRISFEEADEANTDIEEEPYKNPTIAEIDFKNKDHQEAGTVFMEPAAETDLSVDHGSVGSVAFVEEDVTTEIESLTEVYNEPVSTVDTDQPSVSTPNEATGTLMIPAEEEAITEEETRKQEREERIKERRKHIPFNVLMLKQDKHKLPSPTPTPNPVRANEQQSQAQPPKKKRTENFNLPSLTLLNPKVQVEEDADWLAEQAAMLDDTLAQFNVKARVFAYAQGPSVTRFEIQPEPGVKVSKITNLSDDLKLSLAAKDIRIEAPIPGKRMIGIEIPNRQTRPVYLREILEEKSFIESSSPLTVAVGLDISGNPILTDLKKMPHGLVAGSTGSGKSVFINSVLVSLLYKADPSDVRLLLIDPKMVELAPYHEIPHLASPVITDVKTATAALKWAVEEMDRRYELFAHSGARDITRYNEKVRNAGEPGHKLPYLVIIIDELADLMMMSPADVEESICRIAQKARACGIHLLVATQRPSVDVITGLIKANIPTRIAFSVSSQADSRTILDMGGAERLLGKGDMLFLENGTSKAGRLQGTFVTDDEIEKVVEHVRHQAKPAYLFEQEELLKASFQTEEVDELFFDVCEFAVEMGGASISSLQRRFRIGYNRAARLIDMMEKEGVLSESKGSKPRDVLISVTDLENMQDTYS